MSFFFFEGLQPQNVLIKFLFSMKHSYLLTAKLLMTLIILLHDFFTWCERATVGNSLHAGRNFWCQLWPQLN